MANGKNKGVKAVAVISCYKHFIFPGVLGVYLCSVLVVNCLCKNVFHSFSSFFHSYSTPVPVFVVTFSALFPAFAGLRYIKGYRDHKGWRDNLRWRACGVAGCKVWYYPASV